MSRAEALKQEYQQVKEEAERAWALFCWERSCLWSYQAYRTVIESISEVTKRGAFPGESLYKKARAVRTKLLHQASTLPSFEKYKDLREEARECKLVLLDALSRGVE